MLCIHVDALGGEFRNILSGNVVHSYCIYICLQVYWLEISNPTFIMVTVSYILSIYIKMGYRIQLNSSTNSILQRDHNYATYNHDVISIICIVSV